MIGVEAGAAILGENADISTGWGRALRFRKGLLLLTAMIMRLTNQSYNYCYVKCVITSIYTTINTTPLPYR